MAYRQEVKDALRAKYIGGLSLPAAATFFSVTYPTAQRWKRDAKKAGDDWDKIRTAQQLGATADNSIAQSTLSQFLRIFQETLDDIEKNPKFSADEKVKLLSSLSDTYAKVSKAAGRVDPSSWELSLVLDVLHKYAEFVQSHYPEFYAEFLNMHHHFGKKVGNHYGNK